MRILAMASGLVFLAASAYSADVDGKWAGSMSTPNGDVTVNFTFKADATKLTGSTIGPDGNETKIADGKIEGNNLSFSVTFDFGGMPFTMNYKGVLSVNQIKFTLDVFDMPLELVVKKTS
jgi:hypothetical protein